MFLAVSVAGCGMSQKRIEERAKKEREIFVIDSTEKAYALARIRLAAMSDSIAKANHALAVRKSIRIISYYTSSPNSAGGVDAHFRYTNLNDKTIKYLTWEAYPINAVGDAVTCSIRDRSSFHGQDTGPVKKGQSGGVGGYWECAWYNYQIKKMILTGVKIEYMDGSTLEISGDDLYLIGKKKS